MQPNLPKTTLYVTKCNVYKQVSLIRKPLSRSSLKPSALELVVCNKWEKSTLKYIK